jgi:predicted nucleotide-binding protein
MASLPSTNTERVAAELSLSQMRYGVERLTVRISELEGFDVKSIVEANDPRVVALEKSIDETLQRVFGARSIEQNRYVQAARLHKPFGVATSYASKRVAPPPTELQHEFVDLQKLSLALLRQAVKGLQEDIAGSERATVQKNALSPPHLALARKVFVVHGRDEGARHAMARFLEKIALEAIILDEQPDEGRTIIEKFEACAAQVGFAVVLLTPDDIGSLIGGDDLNERARQNVVFELGYFVGRLGRGKACLVRKGNVEIPSDLHGVIYTEMDDSDGWKLKLVKELKAAKLDFDANKIWE